MADPVGMLASCVAVAGLGLRVVKTLDDLMGRWDDAQLSLESLKSSIQTFSASLNILSGWMEREFLESGASSDLSFVKNLALSSEGCLRFLLAMKTELELIGPKPGFLSWRKKTKILWSEERIRNLRDHLTCQNQGLLLLLECRQLSQQHAVKIPEGDQQIMNKVRQDTRQLRQLEDSSLTANPSISEHRNDSTKIDPAKVRENLQPYKDYLAFLAQVTTLEETNPSITQPNIAKLPCAEKIREDYHDMVAKDSDFLIPECPRLRILILGQTGVGKSTICSMVLGISERQAGVSHRGTGTAAHQVWKEITGPENEHLILHDSGGFQPNSYNEMDEIKAFIKYRREQPLLKDQLHCIWYCVSSAGKRNIQKVERDFFEGVDTGQIPVFVIFTQFDQLIKERQGILEDQDPTLSHLTSQQKFEAAKEPAFNYYRDNLEKEVLMLAKRKPQIKICRTAVPNHKESKLPVYRVGEIVGLKDLTKAVADELDDKKGGRLPHLWIAGQRYNADMKLKASQEGCIDQYWRVQKVSKIPIVPIICLYTLGEAYKEILKRLNQYWGLKTKPQGLLVSEDNLHFGFLEATYDAPKGELVMNSVLIASYNFGPLLGSKTAKTVLKMIVGLTLIFERLFLMQRKQGEDPDPLTKEMIREEARKFQTSAARQRMSQAIEKSIFLANCYQLAAAKTAASKAIHAGKSKDAEKYSSVY